MQNLINHISTIISEKINFFRSVSGGDISSAYLLESDSERFFLKVNSKPFAEEMFLAEKMGLEAIRNTRTIAIPNVLTMGAFEGKSFLLMQYIESKRATPDDYRRFGRQLAQMHQCSNETFGFPSGNFIGSLPQSNRAHARWPAFYWEERISPQLELAAKNGSLHPSEIPSKEKAISVFNNILGMPQPSLLHGDLWSGNYLISTDGIPYLIDPAVYYGHSMVDIAMTRLFGGFDTQFYHAYHEIISKTESYEAQTDLYQLYYLLVHLNLFGSTYYSGVRSILRRYF